MPDVTAADMSNGLCTAVEGESRPAASRDQVVVRAKGEIVREVSIVSGVSYILVCLLPPSKEVMFLVRSVCLSVRRITRKHVNGY